MKNEKERRHFSKGRKIYLLLELTRCLIFLGLHLCFSKCRELRNKKVKEIMVFFFYYYYFFALNFSAIQNYRLGKNVRKKKNGGD